MCAFNQIKDTYMYSTHIPISPTVQKKITKIKNTCSDISV